MRGAGVFEGVRPDRFALGEGFGNQLCGRPASAWCGEMGAAAIGLEPMAHQQRLGQHDVDPVGHGFSKMPQKIGGGSAQGLAMKFDEGEFACAINGHEKIKPAFRGLHLGNVDVKKADGVALELLLCRQIAVHIGKPADPVSL